MELSTEIVDKNVSSEVCVYMCVCAHACVHACVSECVCLPQVYRVFCKCSSYNQPEQGLFWERVLVGICLMVSIDLLQLESFP